jgi:hypothetical protein
LGVTNLAGAEVARNIRIAIMNLIVDISFLVQRLLVKLQPENYKGMSFIP